MSWVLVLLEQYRSIHRINPSILFISGRDIVVFVRFVCLHQCDCLLQLIQVLFEDRVAQGVNKFREILDVLRKCCYSVTTDTLDIR